MDGCSGCLKLSGWFSMCFIVYSIPSSCGMLVYGELTSMEASVQCLGRAVVSSWLMKSVVSVMNDGSVCTHGWSQVSMNLDMFLAVLLQLDTIGLMLIGVLWIFFRKYNLEVLCFLGGLQYSNQLDCNSADVCSRSSFVVMIYSCFSESSFSSSWYTAGLFRCS